MRCPTLAKLPASPQGKTGWPWTEESPQLPETMPDGRPWPRISIVTPSYNQGQFIEETIRSVLLQGYPNLEYFIFDGGSTDESVEIIRKYAPWLSYWVSEPDRGQSDAINKGLERSTGEVWAWLNSDDTYLSRAFQEAVTVLDAHPSVAFVYAKSLQTDAEGRAIGPQGEPFNLLKLLTIHNMIRQPAAFIRRYCAEQVGPLNIDFHYVMDWDYWLRLLLVGDVWFEPALWSTHKFHPTAKTAFYPHLPGDLERKKMYETFLERNDLPENIALLKRTSLMHVNLACAKHYYSERRLNEAGRYAWQAFRANWMTILLPRSLVKSVRGLIGPAQVLKLKRMTRKELRQTRINNLVGSQ